jgi:hypothetical protein
MMEIVNDILSLVEANFERSKVLFQFNLSICAAAGCIFVGQSFAHFLDDQCLLKYRYRHLWNI